MPTKQQIITIGVLCVVALGLGYWSGPFKKDSGQRAEMVAPTIITNVVTNVLHEVVTNVVTVQPPAASSTAPSVLEPEEMLANRLNELLRLRQAEMNRRSPPEPLRPIIEEKIRVELKKPTGELTKADLEKVTALILDRRQLTSVKGLEKLTQLKVLWLNWNELTDVKGLEKLAKLTKLSLNDNQLTDVKGLEKLTKLERLNLGSNKLTDVKGLEKLTKLKWLNLRDNSDLTKAQIAELKKALPNCEIYSNFK